MYSISIDNKKAFGTTIGRPLQASSGIRSMNTILLLRPFFESVLKILLAWPNSKLFMFLSAGQAAVKFLFKQWVILSYLATIKVVKWYCNNSVPNLPIDNVSSAQKRERLNSAAVSPTMKAFHLVLINIGACCNNSILISSHCEDSLIGIIVCGHIELAVYISQLRNDGFTIVRE
ncbi:hypothetical protein CEXT_349871 [Caerostris extrusa]|uniref:Uncharacterized protein n=1 Tax=Caerostris extrusa TaxID=172846 RepID=A0AAV4N6X8_CAEEX|nr:hypothetical protein CEXT_349871 [Caerostris extrusa]